jgi:hypothetical protein
VSTDPDGGDDITSALGSSWNVPPYDCGTQLAQGTNTFVVTKTAGPCENRQYFTTFDVVGPLTGSYGFTYQVACNTESGDLTSWLGVCRDAISPCTCVRSPFPTGCVPSAPEGAAGTCSGTCNLVGPCGTVTANRCDGDSGRFCFTDDDCEFCSNQPDIGCATDGDCDFGGCGALPGFCEANPSISCTPPEYGGNSTCDGTCTPAACGTVIADRCDDNPNRTCVSNADCGSCSNSPLSPCENDGDCNFSLCLAGLTNIDNGFSFFNLEVTTAAGAAPSFPTMDAVKTGLLVLGLLSIGVVLILRRAT